jgi:large subunit ribosomal protein L21
MYAVIKTGGKQYRVQPGDVIVVEKLDGEAGSNVSFGDVLMLGGDKGVTLGAPMIAGATVAATLVETRKGEKIKIFKKTRRQGYRRTTGHRQLESVIRVTSVASSGKTDKWDGTVDLTTKAELNARARNLAARDAAPVVAEKAARTTPKGPKVIDTIQADAPAAEAPKKVAAPKAAKAEGEAAPKKAPAKKAAPKADAPEAGNTED